ncbi:MAG: aldehyde dehydrogenase family protein [Candidatus Omnitrophica bacterium]|nr:aldehyde dehydrogenase family protein [Candidatus Omnitrophota bacterium]
MNTKLLIDGKLVETKEKKPVINPSNSELITEVYVASDSDLDAAIAAARKAFDSGPWPKLSLAERKRYVLKIAQGILDKAGELAELETLNTGKPIKESTFMDIPSAARSFEHLANVFEKYLVEDSFALEAQAEARLLREPIGVVAAIVPWNYPLLIASWKLASALAAGNTVILKPSSLTPLTALELGQIIIDAGLPAGVVNIINGSGESIGKALCQDSRIDMLSFTGSNEVGSQILEYSAKHVKKLTMELGGKSAAIVLKDCDVDVAVNSCLSSIFLNQGQMCTAMSRILVDEKIYDKFVKEFVQKAKRIKLGIGNDHETQMGPLISANQRNKVISYVEEAIKEGAKLACGGKIPDDPRLKNGFFFEPTVFVDVTAKMRIFKEEVFGPVVAISKFSSLKEAVLLANDSRYGLAASIWSKDIATAWDLSKMINAGTVWINTYGMFYNEAPYGGFKQSGFGKELGKEGFLEYTRLKNILIDQAQDGKPLVNYWYGF